MAIYRITQTVQARDIRQVRKIHPDATVTKVERNPSRADRFGDAIGNIADAKSEIESLAEEMRGWAENMPENLQGGDKHTEVEAAADSLEEMQNSLEEAEGAEVNFPGMM